MDDVLVLITRRHAGQRCDERGRSGLLSLPFSGMPGPRERWQMQATSCLKAEKDMAGRLSGVARSLVGLSSSHALRETEIENFPREGKEKYWDFKTLLRW